MDRRGGGEGCASPVAFLPGGGRGPRGRSPHEFQFRWRSCGGDRYGRRSGTAHDLRDRRWRHYPHLHPPLDAGHGEQCRDHHQCRAQYRSGEAGPDPHRRVCGLGRHADAWQRERRESHGVAGRITITIGDDGDVHLQHSQPSLERSVQVSTLRRSLDAYSDDCGEYVLLV